MKPNPSAYNKNNFQKPNVKPVNFSSTSSVKTLKQAKRPVVNVNANANANEKKKIIFKASSSFQNKRGGY
jgi:hypothetical protein